MLLGVVAVAVVALARQVGLLHLRIRPLGPGALPEGPRVGSIARLPALRTLRSRNTAIVNQNGIGIVLFASPSCGLCKPVLVGAARLRQVESDLAITVAVDGDERVALEYLKRHGLPDGVTASALAELDNGNRPYAVAVSDEGVVLAAGAVNTLDQLEALADLAKAQRRALQDGPPIAPMDADGGMNDPAVLPADHLFVREPSGTEG
jgi:methylamine dehydrogenase accessory protein MauD